MTDRKELERLKEEMANRGCLVSFGLDKNGYIVHVCIQGAKGIGTYPMAPISAAEKMRDFLSKSAAVEAASQKRELKNVKQHLKDLTISVSGFLSRIDAEMKRPSTPDRGKVIAGLTNALEMANDSARYFALGVDFRQDKKLVRK